MSGARIADSIAAELAAAGKQGLLQPRKRLPRAFLPCLAALIACASWKPVLTFSALFFVLMVVLLLWVAETADDARRAR